MTILRVRRILLFIQIMNKKNGGQRRHFCRELLKITNTYLKIAKSKQKITLHMLCIWVTSLFHQFFTGALLQVCVSQTNNWTCFLCGESLFSWIRVRSFFWVTHRLTHSLLPSILTITKYLARYKRNPAGEREQGKNRTETE